ncbi:glycosyltransferase [Cnuibacter physcomitrellae]|uniref:glycosyltransferase n=1 Tax=Cnuibacter physcomitrellae TaxID=1619308 RepID=UPI00217593B9|nr:glycosyltransferase [Cnuibacter physcomitrellae]MCS5497373.1 glycosyltransferase [Cnuibacter physcomitrellae]
MTRDADSSLRVAAVPTEHPYVRAVTLDADGVWVRPEPTVASRPPGQWWPPVLLDPEYLRAHDREFDVLHLHFGMESVSTAQLRAALYALREARIPLVYTVHDLANPQLEDQAVHLAQLDSVIRAADELITLTPGAADEIRRRWDREATVIPHPRLAAGAPERAPVEPRDPADAPHREAVVGVHLRDLRPNIAGAAVVGALSAAVAALEAEGTSVSVRLRLNESVRDQDAAGEIRSLASASPALHLEQGPRQTDAELERWISDLDAVVLPYAHGTHSGFAELCWDLGVPVLDTGCGYVAEQHPDDVTVFRLDDGGASLTAALASVRPADPGDRRALVEHRRSLRAFESRRIGEAHREVYVRAREGIA